MEINFKELGLDRYEVLCALYDASKPLGMGFMHYIPGNLRVEEAHGFLEGLERVDYVRGRVIKVKLPEHAESFDPYLYDCDNGDGAALAAIQAYAKQKKFANGLGDISKKLSPQRGAATEGIVSKEVLSRMKQLGINPEEIDCVDGAVHVKF